MILCRREDIWHFIMSHEMPIIQENKGKTFSDNLSLRAHTGQEMEHGGDWVARLVAEAERLRGFVSRGRDSGQLPLRHLYDAALPALLQVFI
jgi:hypothetical protein